MVRNQSEDVPSDSASVPLPSLPHPAPAGTSRSLAISCGNLLFAYRDYLFPLLFLILLLTTQPMLPLGSERIDRWVDLLGLGVVLVVQGCRFLAVGFVDNIRRGGHHKRIAAETLIRGGLYAHTRNPLYLGDLLIGCGLVLIANSQWWYVFVLPG